MPALPELEALERDPRASPARAARGQARRATLVRLVIGASKSIGVLTAADLDGSLLLALPVESAGQIDPLSSELHIGDSARTAADYRSVQTVELANTGEPRHRRRFLNRHPEAAARMEHGQLQLWRASPLRVRLLHGDTIIVVLDAADYLLDPGNDPELLEKEQANLEHQNRDHLDISLQLATQILGEADGLWLATGLDPEGMDFQCGERHCRLPFPQAVYDRKGLGDAIKAYLKVARARLGIDWSP
jgi:hypothetical protein